MLNICVDNARVTMENLKQVLACPLGIFLYAVLSGMVGIVILLVFFSMVFAESALPVVLPFIISFNAATSGFYLVDKGGLGFPQLRISLIVISGLLVVTGCFALTVLLPWESMFDGVRYLITGVPVLVCTFFGAWIGSKNKNKDRASQ